MEDKVKHEEACKNPNCKNHEKKACETVEKFQKTKDEELSKSNKEGIKNHIEHGKDTFGV